MNEDQSKQHHDESLSRRRSLAVTLGFYGVAFATGVAFAIYSQESGIRLYLILLIGSIMGALAGYFFFAAISLCIHRFRRHRKFPDQ